MMPWCWVIYNGFGMYHVHIHILYVATRHKQKQVVRRDLLAAPWYLSSSVQRICRWGFHSRGFAFCWAVVLLVSAWGRPAARHTKAQILTHFHTNSCARITPSTEMWIHCLSNDMWYAEWNRREQELSYKEEDRSCRPVRTTFTSHKSLSGVVPLRCHDWWSRMAFCALAADWLPSPWQSPRQPQATPPWRHG